MCFVLTLIHKVKFGELLQLINNLNESKKIVLCAVNSKFVHTNLAVRSIKKYCESQNKKLNIEIYETTIHDSILNTLSGLYDLDADVYGFSCYLWNISYIKELASSLKKAFSGKKDIKIFFGGPEVSFDAEDVLNNNPYVDFVVTGEGEYSVCKLLSGEDLNNIGGLVYKDGDTIITNKPQTEYVDLNTLPFVYGDDIEDLKGRIIYYETSRGCPFKCAYCLSGSDNRVRNLSLDRALEDFMFFIKHNVPLIKLVDRTFNASKSRAKEIISFIAENSQNTRFHMEISADILDDELINIISKVPEGLIQFEIGVQSTNQKTLDAINRKAKFKDIAENVKKLLSFGNIHIHLDLIAGLPYEDYESFKKSFNDCMALYPHMLQLGFLKLLKGSDMRKSAIDYNMQFSDFPPYEILSNDFISFGELSHLKKVEFVLDKVYNGGDFTKTLEFLFEHYKYDYFKLFDDIKDYFEKIGYFNISLSKYQVFDGVYNMFSHLGDKFKDSITFDYLLCVTSHAKPDWIDFVPDRKFLDSTFEILKSEELKLKIMPRYYNVPAKKIIKNVYFHKFTDKIIMFDRKYKDTIDVTRYFTNMSFKG